MRGRCIICSHVGHRIIDYRDTTKQVGIIVISIDENLLREICLSLQETARMDITVLILLWIRKGGLSLM